MTPKIRVKLIGEEAETAYVALPGYPREDEKVRGFIAMTICLDDLIADFTGPRVHLDFNQAGVLIGIEVIA